MKLNPGTQRNEGYSIVEATVAVAITLISLTGCFAANANFLGVLKSANQGASASQSIQERVEQMRIANWIQITDANFLRTNFISSPTASARALPGCTETVTLTAYPPPQSGAVGSTKLTRVNGQVTVNTTDAALKDHRMVKAEWTVTWTPGAGKSLRTRSGAVLVAKGGIVK